MQVQRVVTASHSHCFSQYTAHKEQREAREQAEYSRIQIEHQKSYELSQFSHAVRDRILVTYRAEIESHKLNDRDFCSLRAHIEDLRRRKEALDISVGTLQGDFEAQLSSQEHVIQSMKNELSMFKTKCNEMQRESVEISEMTQQVRIELSEREVELGELSQGIQTTVAHNQSLERECDTLKLSINEG